MIPLESKAYVALAWAGLAALGAGTVFVLARGQLFGGAQLAVFLVMSLAFVVFDDRLPSLFDMLFVVAAILNAAGWVWNIYDSVPGYDELCHFYTSFAVTLSLGFLTYGTVKGPFREHRFHFVLVIASFGISLGAFWEVFEWMILEKLTNPVVDIIMDSAGAILAGGAAAWALGLQAEAGQASNPDTGKE